MWSQKWTRKGNTLLSKCIKRRIALRKCDRRERIKINKIRRDSQEKIKKRQEKYDFLCSLNHIKRSTKSQDPIQTISLSEQIGTATVSLKSVLGLRTTIHRRRNSSSSHTHAVSPHKSHPPPSCHNATRSTSESVWRFAASPSSGGQHSVLLSQRYLQHFSVSVSTVKQGT
jgi:hypothetical protein